MNHITAFPALAIVIAAYLLLAAGGGMMLDGDAYSMTLMSGTEMTLRGEDFFVIAGLVALFFEMLKLAFGARISTLHHILAIVTFIIASNCFVLLGDAGTPSFLMLVIMSLIVVLANGMTPLRNAKALTP
ncbi:hypothetical protein [Aestuariivirga sp.]|uniref:hypothetical protein n=1 Tax=Aestuariivirga sp. TaxID=2650926 RepID=UPI0025C44088|nr:hypothetical protein [Aestuariivirga sp.]MCA3555842.1 hypothetical protein [Aestuariivirga sp.]